VKQAHHEVAQPHRILKIETIVKRFLTILATVSILFSLVLCVIVIVFWLRGHIRSEGITFYREGIINHQHRMTRVDLESGDGGLALFCASQTREREDNPMLFSKLNNINDSYLQSRDRIWSRSGPPAYPTFAPLQRSVRPRDSRIHEWNWRGFQLGCARQRPPVATTIVEFVLPDWLLAFLTALPPARWIVKRVRTRRATPDAPKFCTRCGHDLSAAPQACPRCGIATHKSRASPA
jgi:hypothetical protein